VRISELARAGGVSVATAKFYLREGLLPPGELTAANQATYGPEHVHRLRLIRVMLEVGRMPLSSVREVLVALDDSALPMHDLLAVAHRNLALQRIGEGTVDPAAVAEVDAVLDRLGWLVADDSPARRDLARSVAALHRLGWSVDADVLEPYARAADSVAEREVEYVAEAPSRAESVERLVVGTVVFEAVLAALRRLAEERHSFRRLAERPEG
jgi:DNA-binding transcriptional MerR regulator